MQLLLSIIVGAGVILLWWLFCVPILSRAVGIRLPLNLKARAAVTSQFSVLSHVLVEGILLWGLGTSLGMNTAFYVYSIATGTQFSPISGLLALGYVAIGGTMFGLLCAVTERKR